MAARPPDQVSPHVTPRCVDMPRCSRVECRMPSEWDGCWLKTKCYDKVENKAEGSEVMALSSDPQIN